MKEIIIQLGAVAAALIIGCLLMLGLILTGVI